MAIYYTVLTFLGLSVVLCVLSIAFSIDWVVSKVGRRIIDRESVDKTLLVAQIRLLRAVSFFLVLAILFFYIYLFASLPGPMEGNITGTLGENGTITGTVTINQGFSLGRTFLGFIFAVGAGSAIAMLIQKLASLNEKSYEHVYRSLLPGLNRIACNANTEVSKEIHTNEQSIVIYKEKDAIRNVLIKMKSILNQEKSGKTCSKNDT